MSRPGRRRLTEIPGVAQAIPGVDDYVLSPYNAPMADKSARKQLTESEGLVLSLAAQLDTPTTYTIYAVLEATPTSALQASKGSIYPIVERLKARGYVEVAPVPNSGRGAETLSVTPAGLEAVREWVRGVDEKHVLAYDPMRIRIPALQFLTPEERLEWLANAKKLNQQKADQVDAYQSEIEMAYASVAHSAAFAALSAQSRWLDQLLIALVEGNGGVPPMRKSKPG